MIALALVTVTVVETIALSCSKTGLRMHSEGRTRDWDETPLAEVEWVGEVEDKTRE